MREDAKPFLKVFTRVLRVLNPDLATGERPDARTIAWQLEPYLRNISAWALLQSLLLMGFVMTLVGYVGCFTIIQNSPNSIDTYIWLSAEAFLALIRLLVWAANPSWDDESEGVRLAVDLSEPEPLPVVKCDTNLEYSTFEIMSSGKFWETLVAHSGAMDIDETAIIRGFSAWYSWIKNGEDVEKLSIILQDERTDGWTISCTMNGQNLEFHHVELSSDDGTLTAKQTNRLEEDHALMKLSDFVMDVFDQYRLILEVKKSNSRAIHVSWPLSQSW
ncbi:hypothetical protein B0H14DRAFT_810579 [Mycena olivaceomarginata]|nr:hypothetical protein B0H14DRAFT_810579 [Mycena olivaceomarginata]